MSQVLSSKWLICRICLKDENKLYNIFEAKTEEDIPDLGVNLLEKIELCGGIKLTHQNNLPRKICNRCVLLLRAAYKFRDLCQQSQNQLKHFISTDNQKIDADEKVEISFDSDAEEQTTEVDNKLLTNADYVEESVEEYDHTSYQLDQNSVDKNDYITVINDIEISNCSDDDSLQYVVEKVDAKEFTSEDNEEGETTRYSDNVIVEDEITKPEKEIIKKQVTQKNVLGKKERKNSKNSFIGIYNCTFCDNTYTDKTKYTNHMKIHIKDKPHECEICRKRFTTTPQLSRHMNSHTGNRPYKCQYCEARFGDPSTKIKHERIHTNDRPYKCLLCGKAFAYSNVLKVHMMTHTGEKPHRCEYCGKTFSQLHHKNSHEKRHSNTNMSNLQNSTDDYMEQDEFKDFVEETV